MLICCFVRPTMNGFVTCSPFVSPGKTIIIPSQCHIYTRKRIGFKPCNSSKREASFLRVQMADKKEDKPIVEKITQNTGSDLTLEEIERIIRQFKDSDLPHLYYRQGDSFIELKRKTDSEKQGSPHSFSIPVNNNTPQPQTYNIYIPGPDPSPWNPTQTLSRPEERRVDSSSIDQQNYNQQTCVPETPSEELNKQQQEQPASQTIIPQVDVVSKRVGRFRRGRSKKKPFVEVGDRVQLKQPLCVIEQLGLEHVYFSEVEGVVDKILVQDGDPVEYGQKLMTISTKV